MNEQMAQHAAAAMPRTRRASLPAGGPASSAHQAGHQIGLHPEDRPYQTNEQQRSQRVRASRPVPLPDAEGDDSIYNTRSHTSTRRYAPAPAASQHPPSVSMQVQYQPGGRVRPAAIPARSSTTTAPRPQRLREEEQDARPPQRGARMRLSTLLVVLGVLLLIMMLGWTLLTWLIGWWGGVQNDWQYGRPRVERQTIVVGHADSAAHPTLFFAINDNGHAQVIECPGGDCSHAKVYIPPILVTGDQGMTPVTLSFKDVNGDGRSDLLIHVGEQTSVYLNDQGSFRPVTEKDHVTL